MIIDSSLLFGLFIGRLYDNINIRETVIGAFCLRLFRRRNGLCCVEWGVKLYSLTHACDCYHVYLRLRIDSICFLKFY